MTREEQIIAASFEQSRDSKAPPDITTAFRAGFYNGSIWADANRWVRVEDGLPETSNDNILVYYDGEDGIFYDIVVFDATTKSWYGLFGYQIPTPKMYMYIPEPPKAEQ